MAYKCGNCNVDFEKKERLVAHNLTVHQCEFEEGDPEMVEISNRLKEDPDYQAARRFGSGQVRGA